MRHAFNSDKKSPIVLESNDGQLADPTAHVSRGRSAQYLLMLLGLVAICTGQISCVEERSGCGEGDPNCSTAEWISRIEVANPRFEFVQDLTRSKDFWLRKEDQLRIKYDEFSYLLNKAGYNDCDFTAVNIDVNNCQRCKWCNQNSTECGATFAFARDADKPALVTFAQFMSAATNTEALSPGDGCGRDGYAFTPSENSTLQLKERGVDTMPIAQTNAFVISSGAPRTVTYELKPLDQSFIGVTFFTGNVPPYDLPGGPGLEDNFSTNLHISRVRVLKVKKQLLPLKGKPVQDAEQVRPSRLVFIPDFQGDVFADDGNRCYADVSKRDGDFDLTRCRLNVGDMTGPSLAATPTYLASDPANLLTWVAEFKQSEGSSDSSFDANTEVLVIEFTIDAN